MLLKFFVNTVTFSGVRQSEGCVDVLEFTAYGTAYIGDCSSGVVV